MLQFEEMAMDDIEDDTERDDDSVASDASFLEKLNSGSSRVFRTPCICPTQQIGGVYFPIGRARRGCITVH